MCYAAFPTEYASREYTLEKCKVKYIKVAVMLRCVTEMEKQLCIKIIKYLHDDAKCDTLSAWSWPSRVMARYYVALHLNFDTSFSPTPDEAQYVNPVQ